MSHSPEPWKIDESGDVVAADEHQVVWSHPDDDAWHRCSEKCRRSIEQSQADALRIVACVNACRGIPTEMLMSAGLHVTINDGKFILHCPVDDLPEQMRKALAEWEPQ